MPSKPNPPGCGMQYIVHTYNVIMYLYFYLCLFFSVFLIQGIQGEFKVPSRPNPPGCGTQGNVHSCNYVFVFVSFVFLASMNPRRVQGAK